MVVPVRTQNIIIGNPQSHVIVGTVVIIITAADTVSGFKGTVEPFNHLLVRAELFRDGIIVSPITCVMLNLKSSPSSLANCKAARG